MLYSPKPSRFSLVKYHQGYTGEASSKLPLQIPPPPPPLPSDGLSMINFKATVTGIKIPYPFPIIQEKFPDETLIMDPNRIM